MYYPIRRLRKKQDLVYAKIRLRKKFFLILQKKTTDHKNKVSLSSVSPKHVSFSGKREICSFDKTSPPIVAVIRKPSKINELSKKALIAEADHLKISYTGKKMEEVRQCIISKWKAHFRNALNEYSINNSTITDNEIEQYYNLFLAIKRSTNLIMSGQQYIPQILSLEKIQDFMKEHDISLTCNTTRNACIQAVENYLIDHLDPIESPTGDLSRRRLSATDLFNTKYAFYSASMLRDVISSHHLKVPKSILQKKQVVINILDDSLRQEFKNSLCETLHSCLRYRNIDSDSNSTSELFFKLYNYMVETGEDILEETE